MYNLTFKIPTDSGSNDKLTEFLLMYENAKIKILKAIEQGQVLNKDDFIDECIWEDISSVITCKHSVPKGSYKDWTLWSFHRDNPRWGTPIFGLIANEADNTIYLSMNLSEDWTDEEDICDSICFKCVNPYGDFQEQFEEIMSSHGINYWVKVRNHYLDVFFELINC